MGNQCSVTLFLSVASTLMCFSGAAQAASLTTIASNLNNPRGITFGPNGGLYIAEAGVGGNGIVVPAPELNSIQTFGLSGSITRVRDGVQERVLTDLPSLALIPEGATPPEQAGALLPATGAHDIEFDQNGNPYVLFGYATTTDQQDALSAVGGDDLGSLTAFNINEDDSWQRGEFSIDLVEFEELDNPDDGAFLNNPFDLEIIGETFYIADPGGNNFYSADLDGNVALNAVFPPEMIEGTDFERVPTSVAVGPDGAFYIGELTGNFSPPGSARVLRLLPGGEPEVFAEGFTQIIGLDFDSKENLYVLEFSVNPDAPIPTDGSDQEFTGALFKVAADGNRSTVIGPNEGLVGPGGITVGPDDAVYISNFGTTVGTGQVVRVDAAASVPEPSSALAVLSVGMTGGILLKRRKWTPLETA
ncbi:hypothetical protein XM38_025640 [Halomicronema hongdechloris C2206]|uniref:ScyD/ScyE family protein n=1 Tax=Halomicronema hongdechloris C2206 TaxID=1641165 RepID=A0A1Z3HMU3_9CYAN|nr:ScyD/ScyE family protein [Halomicronema hongdechloris]ASC71611.1 hypothetical protein XM38_025640 [Halomicronema hongdechloris C2206]